MHLSIHKTTVLEGLSASDNLIVSLVAEINPPPRVSLCLSMCAKPNVCIKTPYRIEILTIVLEGCIS